MELGISVVICCYNAAERILPTLKHLQLQEFSKPVAWEVIVVDNASVDKTAEVARRSWDEKPVTSFQVVREERPGLMHARNRGLKTAAYAIVSFIDDDNWIAAGWVEKVYDIFKANPQVGACGGRNDPAFEADPPEWFFAHQEAYAVGCQQEEDGIIKDKHGHLWGAGLSLRKEIWQYLQDINFQFLTTDRKGKELSAGGDTELCYVIRLLGYDLYYSSELLLHHFMPNGRLRWDYIERMAEGFGRSNVRLNCYRALLSPEVFKFRSWLTEWQYAARMYLKSGLQSMTGHRVKRREKKLLVSYWKGVMQQLIADKNRLTIIKADLIRTFGAGSVHQRNRNPVLQQ